MISKTLYHAGAAIIRREDIILPGPREDCDFGRGFYLAESRKTAEEWVFSKESPIVNVYIVNADEKDVLYLGGLDWLRVVVGFRTQKYRVEFKSKIICGPIANDRMNEAMPLFMSGIIGDKRLLECLDLCKLGDQYAFTDGLEKLSFSKHYVLKGQELQRAENRFRSRRTDLTRQLRLIYEKSPKGEMFIRHYLEEGDYIEP